MTGDVNTAGSPSTGVKTAVLNTPVALGFPLVQHCEEGFPWKKENGN